MQTSIFQLYFRKNTDYLMNFRLTEVFICYDNITLHAHILPDSYFFAVLHNCKICAAL